MNEFDVAFELILSPQNFDEDSDNLVDAIYAFGDKSAQFGDVHAGGEATTGLLDIRVQVTAADLPSAISCAYSLLVDAISSSNVKADIRNQTAIAV
jgi:hypothetical protein